MLRASSAWRPNSCSLSNTITTENTQVFVQIDSKLQVITALIKQESKLVAASFLASKMQSFFQAIMKSSLQATMQASGYWCGWTLAPWKAQRAPKSTHPSLTTTQGGCCSSVAGTTAAGWAAGSQAAKEGRWSVYPMRSRLLAPPWGRRHVLYSSPSSAACCRRRRGASSYSSRRLWPPHHHYQPISQTSRTFVSAPTPPSSDPLSSEHTPIWRRRLTTPPWSPLLLLLLPLQTYMALPPAAEDPPKKTPMLRHPHPFRWQCRRRERATKPKRRNRRKKQITDSSMPMPSRALFQPACKY